MIEDYSLCIKISDMGFTIYTYNIKGSVTKVNDPANLGTKLFGYELKYFNPLNTMNSTAKYNGNIAEVTWKTATDNVLRQYNYQYDALNRLKKGTYSEPGVPTISTTNR